MPRKIRENNTGFDSDTTQLRVPKGTTAQRPSYTAGTNAGAIRFNTTDGTLEQWDGNSWFQIAANPEITGATSSTLGLNEDDNAVVTITGTSLSSVNSVTFIRNSDTTLLSTAATVSIVDDTTITATYDSTDFTGEAGNDIDIKVTTASGKTSTLSRAFTISADPVWTKAAGSLATIADGSRTGVSITTGATVVGGDTISYELTSGSLPGGLTLNASSGTISGNASVVSTQTTYTFTLTAFTLTVDSAVRRTAREYSITIGAPSISWTTSAGSLGTLSNGNRAASALTTSTLVASASSGTIAYNITTGALPSGLSLNTSTGAITGTAAQVGTNTTSSFTVTASATGSYVGSISEARAFSILVEAPVVATYTSSGTFSVPSGVSTVDVLIVAGGGGGGAQGNGAQAERCGGGGAGGLIYKPAHGVSPGSSISVTVGNGSGPSPLNNNHGGPNGDQGGPSIFDSLTAIGGGHAASGAGGSGGGVRGPGSGAGGPGQQPAQGGDSGTYGFGNPGGGYLGQQGGGGGGASQAGQGVRGGDGRSYSISGSSVEYAGGGGGYGGNGGNGGGGSYNGGSATANRGGGAAGGHQTPAGSAGKGIVIVAY